MQNAKCFYKKNCLKNTFETASSFSHCRDVFNQLIFDLYGLSKFERQKVADFFLKSKKLTPHEIDEYISSFIETIKPHISEGISIKGTKYVDSRLVSSFIGVKIEFESKQEKQTISIDQVVNYSLMQLVKEIGNANIYTTKDRIYAKNSLFFVRENNIKNWSKSKAYEDAKVFLTDLLK
jgi:hypothetical protein